MHQPRVRFHYEQLSAISVVGEVIRMVVENREQSRPFWPYDKRLHGIRLARYAGSVTSVSWPSWPRTTSTGHDPSCTTRSATLPNSIWAKPVRP
jgi:hypothetical protein